MLTWSWWLGILVAVVIAGLVQPKIAQAEEVPAVLDGLQAPVPKKRFPDSLALEK